uniref:Uncharacterized protein n=1 Tax=Candidatus Kentrum sp. MB TaxID=2138164 RepID=A0A451B936_9GAMM|nr:MAG: hypothetical protein BECKMB1821I_GA0114274_101030 [Candidatus Kentron sp. MB]VFK74804.1 MAG: hypothetical protein BECKMB1821H_GA0114242_101030 [Candidatus Kentron sp. MB]
MEGLDSSSSGQQMGEDDNITENQDLMEHLSGRRDGGKRIPLSDAKETLGLSGRLPKGRLQRCSREKTRKILEFRKVVGIVSKGCLNRSRPPKNKRLW